jgi:hypothetical protein
MLDRALREYGRTFRSSMTGQSSKRRPEGLELARRLESEYASYEKFKKEIEEGKYKGARYVREKQAMREPTEDRPHQMNIITSSTRHTPEEILREKLQTIRHLESQIEPDIYRIYKETKDQKGITDATSALVREYERMAKSKCRIGFS